MGYRNTARLSPSALQHAAAARLFSFLHAHTAMKLIAATIVTGFLGAGKTTLLKAVLTQAHGQKIAVIENEFGDEDIDGEILVREAGERIVQMNNGCICCSIREDLRDALVQLAARRARGELDFERVIIETTGVADPGPVAQTFFLDDDVAQHYMLDAIVTLVDARHAMQQLDTRLEAQRQVGFADRLFISKTDLVSQEQLRALQQRLAHMNPRAAQRVVNFGQAPVAQVLDLRGFNLNERLDLEPDFLREEEAAHEHHHCEHGEHCEHCHGEGHEHHHHHHHHHHDDDVQSFVFRATQPFDPARLDAFLGEVINIFGPKLFRYKGVLWMRGTPRKVIFQGVHQLMGSDLGAPWGEDEDRCSRMVFIGQDVPRELLEHGLRQCLVPPQPR